ncbi:MAG TPA: hypothetical protein VF641_06500 [Methylobacterium sp.]|jgi:hypothetical protein
MSAERDRKFQAKRFNEHAKLLATLFNSLSIATFAAAFVVPVVQGRYDVMTDGHWILLFVGLALHLAAQAAIRLMRRED